MELLFFNPDEYERLYNCSVYAIDQVLYVPCMIAIRKHMDNTCFKFMFYIAIADMICLLLCAILTGYLAIIGAVFCLWVTETTAEMFLAFNRCVELSNSGLANLLFGGKRIYLWMAVPTLYGLYFLMFTKPIIFNGIYITWFQNPHVGYIDSFEDTYRNNMQYFHDFIVVAVLPSIYLLFALILCVKGRQISAAGIPPFIYLLLNRTVRRDVFSMFARPIVMVFPCITLLPPAGTTSIISTLETNHVTTTTTKRSRTMVSQANRVKPLGTIEPCATKGFQKC
uniref:G_PROTEIN_RECEP_F1_2 domain-containing protein n=1 Tax=Globodera pallida TaxID=36090 RepID=A0A183CCH7_GLOPA